MDTKTLAAALLCCSASGQDHVHISIDTAAGPQGPRVLIRAGYLTNELSFSIDGEGRLRQSGEVASLTVTETVTAGSFAGAFGAQTVVLTSDFFFSTGRLAGGNFQYEVVRLDRIAGAAGRVYWVNATGPGQFLVEADSQGTTRAARSYPVGLAGHNHAQLNLIEGEGVYDVTLVAWDANGVYADSEPVTIRLIAGNPVICPADVNGDGQVSPTDFSAWVGAFNTQAAGCDQNGDGICSPTDFSAWVSNFNAGCG